MNFELFVSLRYLLAKRRQTFITLITLISVAGVGLGVMALIVVLAVMNGFQEDLRSRILGITSHVVIGSFSGSMTKYREVMAESEKVPGVTAATPFLYSQVMVSSGRGVSGAVLRGVDPQTVFKVINIQQNLTRGNLGDLRPPPEGGEAGFQPGIILGVELARNLGVRQGDWVTIISPSGRLTPMGQIPKSKSFQVVGLLQSGMYEYDNTLAFIHIQVAQQFLGLGDVVTGVELKLEDIYRAPQVREAVGAKLGGGYFVRDWMMMNQSLFSALKLEKVVMFVILTLIVLVAAFNIVSSLIMLVMEKTRDIAIMKAMGATTSSIRKIFVLEGLIIGVSGTVLGLVGGFLLCGLLQKYKFIELPPDVYYISTLPVKLESFDVAMIALSAIGISLVATLYPSRQAAKLEPTEALRYE
ncbi:MAG: lipoprotein-releasing ABC transporter permease subunit [Acidobacteriota bacterium]